MPTLAACSEQEPDGPVAGRPDAGTPECIDQDDDGFGENCRAGPDCDDHDPDAGIGCFRCARPNQGCSCEPGTEPQTCFLDATTTDDGLTMCHEGTRYCRDGQWTACESIQSYVLGPSATAALIDRDAGARNCNVCDVKCFEVEDDLDPIDGGLNPGNSDGTDWDPGGGITVPDMEPPDSEPPDPEDCEEGVAPDVDCDGIPDEYDPYPDDPPFETDNPAIFMDLAPGETGSAELDLEFFLRSADVYFLLDQTGSMSDEQQALQDNLTSGTFVDGSVDCADTDGDGAPNNELKNEGIIGAIRCYIRDASFGTGFHRELPFDLRDQRIYAYGNDDEIIFGHEQDITSDISATAAAINRLRTNGNIDWPEGHTQALWSLATGGALYMGWDRPGIPERTGCSGDRWGYACFRPDAVPIVMLFTDAPFHNGPDPDYDYPDTFQINTGSPAGYAAVPDTNPTFETAYDLGDVTDVWATYTGDSTKLGDDYSGEIIGCTADDALQDAVFRFDVSSTREIEINSGGSHFDTVVSLHSGIPMPPPSVSAVDNINEDSVSAHPVGDLYGTSYIFTGDTSSMAPDFPGHIVSCGADDDANEAVYEFSLSQATRVAIDTESSSYDTVISLHDQPPNSPTRVDVGSTLSTSNPYDIGDLDDSSYLFEGTLDPEDMEYVTGSGVNCGMPDWDQGAAVTFTLDETTNVRLAAEGATFDTVVGLSEDGIPGSSNPTTVGNTNEDEVTAYEVGDVFGAALVFEGDTSGMANDYFGSLVGCEAHDDANDAVYEFTLSSPTTVQLSTEGSSYDTVMSLHGGPLGASATRQTLTSNDHETHVSAHDLGTLDGEWFQLDGGSTAGMDADYAAETISCNASSDAGDAVFQFTLDSATDVRIDTEGSAYDTVLSLHDGPPTTMPVTEVDNTNEDEAAAWEAGTLDGQALSFSGDTSGMNADLLGDQVRCGAHDDARDAVYRFSLDSTTQVQLDTEGSSYDTVLGLYEGRIDGGGGPMTRPAATDIGTQGEREDTAYDLGTIDDDWVVVSGDTGPMNADTGWRDCGAHRNAADVFFQFTLDSRRTVTIDTEGSSFDTVLGLYGNGVYGCDNDDGPGSTSSGSITLDPGTYYVIIKGDGRWNSGDYQLSVRDDAVLTAGGGNRIACDDDSGSSGASKLVTTLDPGEYYVVVKGDAGADHGGYRLRMKDVDAAPTSNRVGCDDNSGEGGSSVVQQSLAAGTYYVVVKGAGGAEGDYALSVRDLNAPGPSNRLACDNGSPTSTITQALDAGTYYVVIKGDDSYSEGDYTFSIEDLDNSASRIACDHSKGANSSQIETQLEAGTYYVMLRGDAGTGNSDDYTLRVEDADYVDQAGRVVCDNDSGPGDTSHLEADLQAGTYYAVVKGDHRNDEDPYRIRFQDVLNSGNRRLACDDDSGEGSSSRIRRTLDPGTYYAVVKGDNGGDYGDYMLTVGGGSPQTGTFAPRRWQQTRDAMNARGMKVMSILSCHDDPSYSNRRACDETRLQANAIANVTTTLGENDEPLVYDIDSDGSGLSETVVEGVRNITGYLSMDVGLRIVYDPDANPGFESEIVPIDEPGDGCDPPVGLEHQNCRPGATPRFSVSFTNPASDPVPRNPDDPNGGYNFRVELVGDDRYILDSVPAYIIPESVQEPYYESGSYWQDIDSSSCVETERPDWSDLSWTVEMPEGTSIAFDACTADQRSDLDACSYVPVVNLTASGSCTSDADCADGSCGVNGVCIQASGGSCVEDIDCGNGNACTGNTCQYLGPPADIGLALGPEHNLRHWLRMRATLHPDDSQTQRPVLRDWSVQYNCSASE